MDFANKLNELRKEKGITLQELSRKSNVGIATLSRLENGINRGTLRTHQKICEALDIELVDLYKDVETSEDEIISTSPESEEVETFLYDDKASSIILTPNALKKNMLPALIVLQPGGKTHLEQNPKGTEKFLFCVEGKIEATVGEKSFQLKPGGVLYFKSSLAHQLKNTGNAKARCLCISSPAVV
jgi:transcriptional regulator with XRE-family HTH domain